MISWLRKLFSARQSAKPAQSRTAKFDHAQTNEHNARHWLNADALGPVAWLDPAVRKIIRERARYERDNDPHLAGLGRTLAYDLIGTGPRLQLTGYDPDLAADVREVERSFARWARQSRLALALRLMVEAANFDGEVFAAFETDPSLRHPVKLTLHPFEADLVTEPHGKVPEGNWEDGIDYDAAGNPRRYAVQNSHPGDNWLGAFTSNFTVVDAANLVHFFRRRRPGQIRGISEFVSALGVISQLRRYGNAVLGAAEFAASMNGVMHTNAEVEDGPADVVPLEKFRLENGMVLTLPAGWSAEQFKAEQPTASYKEFNAEKLNQIARPVNAPMNVMTGNSSGYNYSSGRLDHVPYHRNIWIDREELEIAVLDRVFAKWFDEARLAGEIPESLASIDEFDWLFQWDGFSSIDPLKDALASEKRMQLGLTTLSEECAGEGRNWREVLEQLSIERAERTRLGLPDPLAANPPPNGVVSPADPTGDDGDGDDDEDPEDETDDTTLERDPAGRGQRVLV